MPLPKRVSDPTGPGKSVKKKKSAPDGRNSVAFLKGNASERLLGDECDGDRYSHRTPNEEKKQSEPRENR
jgi:hypothetical protein